LGSRLFRARDGDRGVVFVLGWLAVLLLGWNALAARFDPSANALRVTGPVFDRAARDLPSTLAVLPAPATPRVAVFGSSQIAVVKRGPQDSLESMPHRLADALAAAGRPAEVVDFSDGGQQVVESLCVDYATRDVSRASAVVVGVSLFAMTSVEVRATLFEHAEGRAVADAIRAALPADADPAAAASVLAWTTELPAPPPARPLTIQEQLDLAIGGWLDRHVAAYANRQRMYRELFDAPVRLWIAAWQRKAAGATLSSRYSIGPAYAPSLLALELLRRSAAERGVPFLVVVLPFDHARPPIPFDAETQARVVADVGAIAARAGEPVLDLGDLLGSEHFGTYEDGSPDNLHYDAAGHALVAERIAERLAPRLAGSR
jgi:hypothetical protein